MRILSTIIFIMFLFLTSTSVAKNKEVILSQISDKLTSYQGTEMDYIKDTIRYTAIDRTDYDSYFFECAEGYATMVQLNKTLVRLLDEQLKRDDDFVVTTLAVAAEKIIGFKAKFKRLDAANATMNPEQDFKGIEKRKLPEVVKGMARAQLQIMQSMAMLAFITENLAKASIQQN